MATATLDPEVDSAEDDARWEAEFGACAADPAYLIDTFGVIDKPKRPGARDEEAADELGDATTTEQGTVPFKLWPAQVPVLGTLVTERLVVILKARQLGISWIVCGYVLWLCLFHPHQAIFLFSRRQKDANELIRRIKALYHRLPGPLRDRLPRIAGKDNVRELLWSNGSRIESMPDTKDSGVGNTASLVVLDEWARMRWGGDLFESVSPVMEAGGQLVVLTTANGMNWFHDLWDKAIRGANTFRTVFLPWWARPGRDVPWYERTRRNSNDLNKFKENYPANPTEAFRATGRVRFQKEWIDLQAPNVAQPLAEFPTHRGQPEGELRPASLRGVPGLRVYAPPRFGRRYIVASDVAEGKETSNYDTGLVLDADSLEEMATLHGQWEPDTLALWLIALSDTYGEAPIVVERNNHGHATIATLKLKGYLERIAVGHDGCLGWLTNGATKAPAIDLLAEALRDATIAVRSQMTLNELAVYKRLKNGATGAEPPAFDDLVMTWAIALAWLRLGLLEAVGGKAQARPNPLIGYRG